MPRRYSNPVYPAYFADPFVLRWRDEYYAYGTADGLVRPPGGGLHAFPILRSRDLLDWQRTGAALELDTPAAARAFWAPEVAERDGRFYLYYSTAPRGEDERHRLHVAVADGPGGPFFEQGLVLPESEGFSIDAHPFRDPRDGRFYLFFAKDYFDERTGTGLAVVTLDDPLHSDGPSSPVLRATADWQVYQRDRLLYGRRWPAWHTLEGPCVVFHDGLFYCLYSGGNWQTGDYGVGFAVSPHPLGPWRHADEEGPSVLRQRPEALGPGHCSYAVAGDGSELLVYHAWDDRRSARRMCLDRLTWTPRGPRCLGPTTTPQEASW